MKRRIVVEQTLLNLLLAVVAFLAIFPFVLIIISSLTSNEALVKYGYSLFPKEWSLEAYRYLIDRSETILRAYGVTVIVAVIGTITNLALTCLLAYPLSRRDMPGRKIMTFMVFFTMLFNGGLVPTYIWYTNFLGVKNTIWGLIVPGLMMRAFNVMIVRTFMTNNVPMEVIESGQIDGASEYNIFARIVFPMSRPIIATILLFVLIDYWNDWYNGMIYITDSNLYSIQNFLVRLLNDIAYLQSSANIAAEEAALLAKMPTVSVRLAIAIVGIIPIMIAYPFMQKNFVKGIAIGSVKG